MSRNPSWSPTEDAKLPAIGDVPRRMTREHWQAIAEQIGNNRTWMACRQRYLDLRRKEHHRGERKANGRIDRRTEMQQPPAPHTLPRPVSITAAVFGDPLPGRSALDKRPQADTATAKLLSDLPRRSPLDQMRTGIT